MGTRVTMSLAVVAALFMLMSSYFVDPQGPSHAVHPDVVAMKPPLHARTNTEVVAPSSLATPTPLADTSPHVDVAKPLPQGHDKPRLSDTPQRLPSKMLSKRDSGIKDIALTEVLGATLNPAVSLQEALAHLRQDHGVAIASVTPGGPALKAGIEAGDLLLEIDGKGVTSFEDVSGFLASKAHSDIVTLFALRKNAPITLSARLDLGPAPPGAPPRPRLGISLEDEGLSLLRSQLNFEGGLWVSAVGRGSMAERGGILPGDVLVRVNGRILRTHRDLAAALKEAGTPSAEVLRAGSMMLLTLPHTEAVSP